MLRKLLSIIKGPLYEAVVGHFITFIFGLIFTIIGTATISRILADVIPYLSNYRWYISAILIVGGIWLFLHVFLKRHRFKPHFPNLNADFEVIEKRVTYRYSSISTMTYKKGLTLRALRNFLDRHVDKYHWTGNGQITIQSLIANQSVHLTERKSLWQFYEIHFPYHLKKGKIIDTELEFKLNDTGGTAVPFLSATIEEPTRKLTLIAEIDPSLNVKEVICETSSTIGNKDLLDTEIKPLDPAGRAVWLIRDPKLLYHYNMRWTFPLLQGRSHELTTATVVAPKPKALK